MKLRPGDLVMWTRFEAHRVDEEFALVLDAFESDIWHPSLVDILWDGEIHRVRERYVSPLSGSSS